MNLEQQKKRARELLRGLRAGDVDAMARLRQHHARWTGVDAARLRQTVALHDAQFVLAREQGFASWPKLKAHAEPPADSRQTRLFITDLKWFDDRVQGLVHARTSGVPAALDQIREWHPRFAVASDESIQQAPFDTQDAQLVYAREHGFDSWDEFAARVAALAAAEANDAALDGAGEAEAETADAAGARADGPAESRTAERSQARPARRVDEPFMAAFLAMKAGDVDRLRALLRAHPDLARARGTNGNSLLNLAGSLAGSALRAGASVSAAERDTALAGIDALLTAGADADQPNDRGWTPLHQAAYSNQPVVAERLIAAGASLDAEAHGAGGTPLIVSLFWGHRETADLLATHGVTPRNLRAAAGLGDLALVESFFTADGSLTPNAGVARGFYRPHSGFPDWQPSPDPQEVLDEALVWACKSDRVEVLERLVKGGARIDADPYRGTPLTWAAFCNRARTVRWLLDHGAPVNRRATFGGPGHGQGVTALHLAAQSGHLSMVTLLVECGADFTIQDDLYHGTPAGWAEYSGSETTWDYLRSLQAASGGGA